jgi:serine/threonine-protein kinase
VALKSMAADLMNKASYRERFKREVSALRSLNHPNIVGYKHAFAGTEGAYMVMEYVSGGTLQKFIDSRRQLPPPDFKAMALKIIDAIRAAHEAGIVHRDLKPANILLMPNGEPKVGDFGVARIEHRTRITQSGAVFGTLAYLPPEAFQTTVYQDHRGDIWAMGIIMFEMLTSVLPFSGNSQTEMLSSIVGDKPFSLRTYRKDVPSSWTDIILRCLAKEPNRRYDSARDLYTDLRNDMYSPLSTRDLSNSEDIVSMPLDEMFAKDAPLAGELDGGTHHLMNEASGASGGSMLATVLGVLVAGLAIALTAAAVFMLLSR